MINVDYPVLEDGDVKVVMTSEIFEGSPISLDPTGQAAKTQSNLPVYGLSKVDRNSYRDLAYGDAGAYGAKKITVLVSGKVSLYPSWYENVDGTETVVQMWENDTFHVNDELYASTDGKITTDDTLALTNFGRVVESPTTANGGIMRVLVYGK